MEVLLRRQASLTLAWGNGASNHRDWISFWGSTDDLVGVQASRRFVALFLLQERRLLDYKLLFRIVF